MELILLLGLGVSAALARCFFRMRLGIPGNSILLVVLPVAVGVALTRRRRAGTVMGLSSLSTALMLNTFGVGTGVGMGAMTSLALTGPALDLCLETVRNGRGVYLACVVAGVASNALAFIVRAGSKMAGLQPGYHPNALLRIWAPRAIVSYTLCGLLAGLISAWVCFKLRDNTSD